MSPDASRGAGGDLREEAVALAQRLIRFDTVNPPGNEREALEFVREHLEGAGFECELIGAMPERPNLIARLAGGRDGPRLCYLGHIDTVLADPAEWSVDPWSGELRDGYLWGRGALDMKGQVAAEVAGACALARSGWKPAAGELTVAITCDEEGGGSLGARWLCENVPDKVRCDFVVTEGGGGVLEFAGRRLYTLCIGEKGVFRLTLTTDGRAGHASQPNIGDNALLRMVEVLGRLGGRQPELDSYLEADTLLAVLLGHEISEPAAALEEIRSVDARLADLLEPIMGVTLTPTKIRASEKENVIPSRCSVRVDCRVPPGLGEDHARRRIEELIGAEGDGYSLRFEERMVGNSSPFEGELIEAVRAFVGEHDSGAGVVPIVLPGFTDSHWFRNVFPGCVAYGFFPQKAMTPFETAPLIHAPNERIALDDIEFSANFFRELAPRLLD